MTAPPTIWNRLVCRLHGEVPADTLEAYRRASLAVHDLLEESEQRRLDAQAKGLTPWTLPTAQQAELLCTWNAYVLQTLGDKFLEADYAGNPITVGYVPPITADQVLGFYTPVEGWLSRAHEARANPHYRLDVAVPSDLPAWSEVEPCPNAHLYGMLEAMRAIRHHADRAMEALPAGDEGLDKDKQAQLGAIRQMYAAATSKARYADDLHGTDPSRTVHERVEPHVKAAIEGFYRMGQLAAMPALAGPAAAPPRPAPRSGSTPRRLPLPGEPGFDPWCLTAPDSVRDWKADPEARRAIARLWQLDPDPARTLQIKGDIDAALARGDVALATDRYGKKLGHFFCCPWGPVYQVVRPVTLAGQRLNPLQQFVYDVTCEGVNVGAHFTREIMVGNFQPTTRHEYGDPDEAPDH